ncbi:MAG: acyltransferase [Planctomycetaceae bacterium]|jgi:maltose O-acetyltransferase|nr:acyltransferase [Planctomycetaceae bacterium]
MFRSLQKEFSRWVVAILEGIPGKTGESLRNKFYGYKSAKGVRILRGVTILHPDKCVIGANSGISSGTQINAAGGVQIGKDVLIGPNCIIWSQNHRHKSKSLSIREQGYEYKPVVIDDDVWIAASCVILPGVTLGKGCVIAAGAVVTKSIPSEAIAAGVPAKVVGMRGCPEDAIPGSASIKK